MINNTSGQRWERVNAKSLDQQFVNEMIRGLQCSRFEAQAILEKVHEVFGPLWSEQRSLRPGQIQLCVVEASVGAGVPLRKAAQQLVTVTLDERPGDSIRHQQQGVAALRRHRLVRIAEETFQQGGVLTLEDIAALFNCGVRTLVRDLKVLQQEGIRPPLRSLIQDMGRAVSHRRQIVQLWLQGHEYTEIARRSRHRVDSVASYVSRFKRCAALFERSFDLHTVAFLVCLSPTLTGEFYQLWSDMEPVAHRLQELQPGDQKKDPVRAGNRP